ncbi:MAG: hypothetical protein M1305_04120 [Candidatus Marsarchaeota archaeon]|nr:hypothetical protein [Candidatus Marsarchaeota archaeon]
MARLKNLNGFQVKRRLNDLRLFRQLFIEYTHHLLPSDVPFGDPELTLQGHEIKEKMDKMLHGIIESMYIAGTYVIVDYTAPPVAGRTRHSIDLMRNIDHLHNYDIHPRQVVSVIDETIGVFERDIALAWMRTFWPLFWIHKAIARLVAYPFQLWSDAVGGKHSRSGHSCLQGTATFAGTLLGDVVIILSILKELNFLEPLKHYLHSLVR